MATHKLYSILTVDDNPNNLFTLRTLLESSLDADVIEAQSGAEALEKISEQKIDLILLDIQMPEMNGFEVAKLIRNRRKFQNIPIIFLTAVYKSEDFKQQGFASGAIDYLTKPIDDTILLSRVKAYLRVIESERESNRRLSEMNDRLSEEIEARKRAEIVLEDLNTQLKDASRHKTDYLSSMSHELRTPLNALIGYLFLSVNELQAEVPPEKLQNLTKANQTARVILQLINDVLDFAKIEAGKMDVLIEEVDVAEIIEDVAITAEGLLLNKPVKLLEEVASDLPVIQSDYTKIKQMLNNLISNAIKFTTQGSVAIRAKWLKEQSIIRIEVEDTGPGIPPEKISSVFESFKQVDSSITKKFGGTGLGLAITKQFCDMLGMAIGIESEVGRGTTFWVHIPVETGEPAEIKLSEAAPQEAAREHAEPTRENGTHSVLIVDDDEINLQVMSEILRLSGYHLHQSLSAEESIQIARQTHPDIILMDLAMPGMDGVEASQILKNNPDTADIPIIACTAHVTQETRERALSAGCDAFLTRPIAPQKLLRHIATLLEKQKRA